jgi:hypothetical protein
MDNVNDWDRILPLRDLYGDANVEAAFELLNELAPVTRRDDWWGTVGPIEIIIQHLRRWQPETYKHVQVASQ